MLESGVIDIVAEVGWSFGERIGALGICYDGFKDMPWELHADGLNMEICCCLVRICDGRMFFL